MKIKQILGSITGRYGKLPNPENSKIARQCATEGIVLLKNNGVLPLKPRKIALWGAGAIDTMICGTGSGYVFPAYKITVQQGLMNAGFELSSTTWLKRFAKANKLANKKDSSISFIERIWDGKSVLIDDPAISEEELEEAKSADIAIYVIRRNAGEDRDRKPIEGDYYLSDSEKHNLQLVTSNFQHTIVVLNTCVVEASTIEEIPGVDAIVYLGLAGLEAGNALADILTGKVCPSGKLTDTWARQYSDYPAAETFSSNDGNSMQEDYIEDILVGYRWFDTKKIEPLYPFGYGLSYTFFRRNVLSVTADWNNVSLEVEITNTGRCAGRDVVQVYVSAPSGRLAKPYQELKGFAKTKTLPVGGSEVLQISFATETLASFDESISAYVMEPGNYFIRVGCHSRETEIAAVIHLDAEAVTRTVTDILHQDKDIVIHHFTSDTTHYSGNKKSILLKASECATVDNISRVPKIVTTYIPEGKVYTPHVGNNPYQLPFPCKEEIKMVRNCPDATLLDVYNGMVSLDEFVASLEDEILVRIVAGNHEETPYAARNRLKQKIRLPSVPHSSGQTTALFLETLGIPVAYLFDGPAGLHIPGCAATAFPAGTIAAQTWDTALLHKLGNAYGKDMEYYHVTIALGPGMNIHRDPLCGRSFEYYSEDPLLSGMIASAFTKGLQSVRGRGVAIKHFACNNQENDRKSQNSTVSVRALREIYLKGFEICVKESKPMAVMTSYNKLNGIHTGSNRELITDLLRGEWGFNGCVMSDWGTKSEKTWDLHAGNDLIMGGYRPESILCMLQGKLPVFETDGTVKETMTSAYFGTVKRTISNWGCFVPDADGKDSISTHVSAEIPLNPCIEKACQDGLATVASHDDGSKTVTYYGINKGAHLMRGDIQACVIRILKCLMNSSAMDDLLRSIQ